MTEQDKIDLMKGAPAADLVPTPLLKGAAQDALSQPDIGFARGPLDYGADFGYQPLRESIASWLATFYQPQSSLTADNICITGGASQNLACILQVFADLGKTETIWLVEPVYFLAVRMFDDAGFHSRIRAVPENEDGIDLDYLQRALDESSQRDLGDTTKPSRPYSKVYKHMLYCVPTFANPSGKTMPLHTRQELVRIARRHDLLVVCDDVYDFLQWPSSESTQPEAKWESQLPRVVDVDSYLDGGPQDEFGNVVSNGSFSKIIAPGVRVGWAQSTAKFAEGLSQAGSTRSGGAPSQMTSSFINVMVKNGSLTQHITDHLIPSYRRRHQAALSAVKEHLSPLGLKLKLPSQSISHYGGYFVWLRLPPSLRANEIAKLAFVNHNLTIGYGQLFEVPETDRSPSGLKHYIRLSFAWEPEPRLEQGIATLARVIRDLMTAQLFE